MAQFTSFHLAVGFQPLLTRESPTGTDRRCPNQVARYLLWMAKPAPKSGTLNGIEAVGTGRWPRQLEAMVRFT